MVAISFSLAGQPFELSDDDVRARVARHRPDAISQYWVEIDGTRWPVKQVMALATGLGKGDFQSQNSRRLLAKLGFTIGTGNAVIVPATAVGSRAPRSATKSPVVQASRRSDIVLVCCVKSKRSQGAMAKDLYISDYFMKMPRYAEASGLPWFIFSAEHWARPP